MPNASEIFAPPSTNTQGCSGACITRSSAATSSANNMPAAVGLSSWKATMEGAFAVGGGEGVVHVVVDQRRQSADKIRVEHFPGRQFDGGLKGRDFLAQVAEVAEQNRFSGPQGP